MLTIKMAWRNLWRNRRRTLLTISAVGLGLAILIILVSFTVGMIEMMVDQIAKSSLGRIQIHNPTYLEQRSAKLVMTDGAKLLKTVEGVDGVVAASPRLLFSGAIRSSRASSIHVVSVNAVDPDHERELSSLVNKVVDGGFLAKPDGADDPNSPLRIRNRKGVLIGSKLAKLLKVNIGSKVRLDTAGLRGSTTAAALYVTGILHAGSDSVDKSQVWVRLDDMQELTGGGDVLHEIAVVARDTDQVEATVQAIRKALGDRAVEFGDDQFKSANLDMTQTNKVQVLPWWDVVPDLKKVLDVSQSWTGVLYFLMLIILSAGILTTMYMVVYERRREFGVRLALGAGSAGLFAGLMFEALFIAALSALVGLVVGGIGVALLVNVGIDLSWLIGGYDFAGMYIENIYRGSASAQVFVEPTIVVFVGTVLIALWPSLRVARMKPLDAIGQGGSTG